MSTWHPETCEHCHPHPWHGLPCVRHNAGVPCGCESAWSEAS